MGGFVGTDIQSDQLRALQENVIAAVQTNVGPFLPDEVEIWSVNLALFVHFPVLTQSAFLQVVCAAIVCRINCLAQGNSAILLTGLTIWW